MPFTLTELPANLTYTMQIPYGGVFDWTVWLPFFIVVIAWMGLIYFAERRKDVVLAMLSLIMAFVIYTNTVSESVFTIGAYGVSFIFAIISIYEFFILAIKYREKR
jgi:hypothetical protein